MYSIICFRVFLKLGSLYARQSSHYKAWIYKKTKHKKIKAYRESLCKEPTVNRYLLNLALKPYRLKAKGKHFTGREFQGLAVRGKKLLKIDILVTSRNGDRQIMQTIRIMSRPPSRTRKWNQLSQFWRISTKVIPREKT